MPFDPTSVVNMETLYNEGKFWIAFGGLLWSVFKAAKWVKEIKTVDLFNLQTAATELRKETQTQAASLGMDVKENAMNVSSSIKEQTAAVVREIGELRQDFRTFYISPQQQMVPARSRTPRPKAKTAAKARK